MNKTVLITGSSRGIGKAIAIAFAKKGYDVILNSTKKNSNSEATLKQIQSLSKNSAIYYFDVADRKSLKLNCQKIRNKYKTVDILVNNAGIVRDKTLLKMTYSDWNNVIKVNLTGVFNITKELLPMMTEQKWGRIISISSVIALSGNFGQTNYSATKAGIIGFTKSLAKETARYNITVNAVCPGFVETEMLKNIPKAYLDKILERIPMRRLAKPSEIADLVLFLASEKCSYITGEYISINGGLL